MTSSCLRCGNRLSPSKLDGLCPHCLARNLLSNSVEDTTSSRRIGDYEIISELGRGGMGIVYLARETKLDRLVALKILAGGVYQDDASEQRFLSEARITAQLQHPNIVRVFETGQENGTVFYSMEFIEGDDLSNYQRNHHPDTRQNMAIVAKAARAVHHAHEMGLIHRDVKPSNILIDPNGEPHLTDFGLAMTMDSHGWLTQTGQILGSPSFMAPEQMAGHASAQSDIYALGAVLYLLLTGRPPLVASKLPDLLKAIDETDPPAPTNLDASIPPDLSTIALHSLNKTPHARYSTALALAEDLEAWIEGRPIQARPLSKLSKAHLWARRNRMVAASLSIAFCVALVGSVAVAWQWRKAQQLTEARRVDLYAANLKISADALSRGDLGVAEQRLESCPLDLRDAAWGLLKARSAGNQISVIGEQPQTVVELAFSPDRRTVAAASQGVSIKLIDTKARTTRTLPDTAFTWSLDFSPDGNVLISADTEVKEWDLNTARVIRTWPGKSATLSPDGQRIATCAGHRFLYEGEPGPVTIWDRETGEKLALIDEPFRMVRWSHDGRFLLVGDAANSLSIRDGRTGQLIGSQWDSAGPFWSIGFSPDDQAVFASGWSREVRIWRRDHLDFPPQRLTHPRGVWTAAYSPDGKSLAVACSDRCIYIWDTTSGLLRKTERGHHDEVWSLAWENNERLVSSGRDPHILLWDTTDNALQKPIFHDHPGYRPLWLSQGKLMVVHGRDAHRSSKIVELSNGNTVEEIPDGAPAFRDPSGAGLWIWTADYALRRVRSAPAAAAPSPATIEFENCAEMDDLPQVRPAIDRAWGPSHDGGIIFWQLSTGKIVERWPHCFDPPLRAGAMSPDGRYLAWSNHSASLALVDLKTGQRRELKAHVYEIDSLSFSPDSRWLLSAGVEGKLILWDTRGKMEKVLLGTLATSAGTVAFSPDGKIVAALEPGVGIHLWHVASRNEVDFIPIENQETNNWLDFSPDGRWLATRSNDGRIHAFAITEVQRP